MIQTDKLYQKLIKKQTKELENLQRKHEKETIGMLRTHTLITDKLNMNHAKERLSIRKKHGLVLVDLIKYVLYYVLYYLHLMFSNL